MSTLKNSFFSYILYDDIRLRVLDVFLVTRVGSTRGPWSQEGGGGTGDTHQFRVETDTHYLVTLFVTRSWVPDSNIVTNIGTGPFQWNDQTLE